MDTWSEIREFQRRHRAVCARLRRRRKQRYDRLIEAGVPYPLPPPTSPQPSSLASPLSEHRAQGALDPALERRAHEQLLNPLLEFPLPCKELSNKLNAKEDVVLELLQKFSAQQLLELQVTDAVVSSVNADKLSALAEGVGGTGKEDGSKAPRNVEEEIEKLLSTPSVREMESRRMGTEIHELINTKSVMEKLQLEKFRSAGGSQLQEFCSHKTRDSCRRAKGSHRACGKLHFRKIIQQHTDESLGDCSFLNTCFHTDTCKFVHYEIDTQREVEPQSVSQRQSGKNKPVTVVSKPLLSPPPSLSHLPFLLHLPYFSLPLTPSLPPYLLLSLPHFSPSHSIPTSLASPSLPHLPPSFLPPSLSFHQGSHKMTPPQWINCDLRSLDMTCLGKFSVVMADPPWDIHMELPYGEW